jgi:hypothetical protein
MARFSSYSVRRSFRAIFIDPHQRRFGAASVSPHGVAAANDIPARGCGLTWDPQDRAADRTSRMDAILIRRRIRAAGQAIGA